MIILAALFLSWAGREEAANPRIWMRSYSIEWQTNMGDQIAVYRATSSDDIDPLNEHHFSRRVVCKKLEDLRGSAPEEITFQQDHHRNGKGDRAIAKDQKLLFFRTLEDQKEVDSAWINLTAPDRAFAFHAAYDNQCRLLRTEKEILDLVRLRLKLEGDLKSAPKKRGIIVFFHPDDQSPDIYWDFVVTAEDDLMPKLIESLKSKYADGRSSAIYNLLSYPGEENEKRIRALLDDPEPEVRHAASLALILLGEKRELPNRGFRPWLFQVGFEDRIYFPSGNWKRLE